MVLLSPQLSCWVLVIFLLQFVEFGVWCDDVFAVVDVAAQKVSYLIIGKVKNSIVIEHIGMNNLLDFIPF